MPPKNNFTKEEIICAAVEIVKRDGIEALTARSLAKSLGTSTKPIFGLFESMDKVQAAVIFAANALYLQYLQEDITSGKYPPYKASGMGYIRFAREQKQLFKLLFMRDRSSEKLADGKEALGEILAIIMKNLGLSEQDAFDFHMKIWIYVHGIASMIATGFLDWDGEFASNALTDAYTGLKGVYLQREKK